MNRTTRHMTSLATAVVLAVALAAGCSAQPPAISASVAEEMTHSVVDVAGAASEGDLAGAVVGLDELQGQLDAAVAAEQITPDRAARVQLALDAVRTDVTLLAEPVPSADTAPAPQEPVPPDPAVEQPVGTTVDGTVQTPVDPGIEPATPGTGPGPGTGQGNGKGADDKGKGSDTGKGADKGNGPGKGKEKSDG